jgi:hypothetical protein
MSSFNDYWAGIVKANLRRDQISADWGQGENSGIRIDFVNRAFKIYYDSRTSINRCGDPHRRRVRLAELEASATDGFGFWGANNLKDAFQHLAENGGRWTDGSTKCWSAGADSVFHWTSLEAPDAMVNFMESVDGKMHVLWELLAEKYVAPFRQLFEASQQGRWERLGAALEAINTVGGEAERFLWTAPDAQEHLGGLLRYTDVLSDIHAAFTEYANLTGRRGVSPGSAIGYIALNKAVGELPILGNFYGQALGMIPKFRDFFANLTQQWIGRIDREMDVERWR